MFDFELLHFNPENPFLLSDWARRASAAEGVGGGPDAIALRDDDFGTAGKKRSNAGPRGRRKARKGTSK